MNDPEPTGHWNDLAQRLGIDVPAPADENTSDSTSDDAEQNEPQGATDVSVKGATSGSSALSSSERAAKKRRAAKRLPPVPEKHWDTLAGSLGIEIPEPPQTPPTVETESLLEEPPSTESSRPMGWTAMGTPQSEDSSDLTETTVAGETPSDTRDNFMDEIPAMDVLDAESKSVEEATESDTPAETSGRKRRRRGRRGRRRRTSPEQGATERASTDKSDAVADDDTGEELAGEPGGAGDDGATVAARSDGGRDAAGDENQEGRVPLGVDGETAGQSDSFDDDSASDDTTDDSSGPGTPGDSAEDHGRSKRAIRRFPTWSEAVGVIVTSNIESRQKSGSSSGPRGRRRKSGGRKR